MEPALKLVLRLVNIEHACHNLPRRIAHRIIDKGLSMHQHRGVSGKHQD